MNKINGKWPKTPSFRLDERRALVTGASQGIGLASAVALAEAGADVVLVARREKEVNSAASSICARNLKAKAFALDITDISHVKKMVTDAGPFHILVNNAGNNIPEHFTKVKTKNMEYLVKINTVATFNLAQLCALKMIELKNRKKIGGAIVNMSSQMGHVGGPIRSVYNMTKAGLEGLTKGMALDLAKDNIRVNTVCPTFIITPMTKKFLKNKKFKNDTIKNIPLGKFANLDDVATTVAFLASDASSMITGTSILVDGGWTAK